MTFRTPGGNVTRAWDLPTLVLHYFHMYIFTELQFHHQSFIAIYHIFTAESCRRQETAVNHVIDSDK